MKYCDLHSHSYFSDGSMSPTDIIRLAEEAGLSAVALTDHNTSKGLSEFVKAAENSSVEAVPGCEFSTDYDGTELHIVGLFFPKRAWTEIEDYVFLMHLAKKNSNKKMISALQKEGYDITYEEVAATTDAKEFNRAHVARVLVSKGYVETPAEAFDTLLREEHGLYKPPKRLPAISTIKFIKFFGAIPVLAHPFLNMSYNELLEFLPKAKEAGLQAIETNYSTFDEEQTKKAIELAEKFGLKQSGGSDFHGPAKPDISLGIGRGNLHVPYEFYENLKP